MCVCVKSLQSCPTLCNHMDFSPPGSPVHRILHARILEWVAISSCRGSSRPRDGTCISNVSYIGRQVLYHWRHLGSPGMPSKCLQLWSFTSTPTQWVFSFLESIQLHPPLSICLSKALTFPLSPRRFQTFPGLFVDELLCCSSRNLSSNQSSASSLASQPSVSACPHSVYRSSCLISL